MDDNSVSLPLGANQTVFPGFLGQGYVIVGEDIQTFLISIDVPIATTYRLVLRYLSETIGFVSFRFTNVDAAVLDIQGVFPLSSINSPDYTQANVLSSNALLEVDITSVMNVTSCSIRIVQLLILFVLAVTVPSRDQYRTFAI